MGRLSIFWQLFLIFGLLIAFALGAVGFIVGMRMEQAGLKGVEERLRIKAALLYEFARSEGLDALRQRLRKLHEESGSRITLIAGDGSVLADTDADEVGLDNHGERPEIAQARLNSVGAATRFSTTTQQNMMYVARRVDGAPPLAFVRVALPLSEVEDDARNLRTFVWVTAGVTAALVLFVAWWLTQRVAEPLGELGRGAAAVAGGKYGQKVYLERRDELGQITQAFNQMSERLAEQFVQIEHDRQQLRAVLGSMVEGVIAADAEWNVIFANERAGELLGFSASQAAGRKMWEIVRHRAVQDLMRDLLSSTNGRAESRDAAGFSNRNLTVHGARLPGVPVRGAVLVFHDVTELRRLERLRQEFVANVSHELKTPLSVIVACVETLQNGAVEDVENRTRFLRSIATQAQSLSALILDLLTLARVESGAEQTEPQQVAVEELIQACVERHLDRSRAKQQRLELLPPSTEPAEVVAWADRDALTHILENLIDNAIKYTPAEGSITLHWRAEGDNCVIDVRDTGIGIPENELPRIFERFYRVDKARSRELGGTGLGLAIVKHLVQSMGGVVRVASEVGRGTTFTLLLPLSQPSALAK